MADRSVRYPQELRERAVRLVAESRPDHATECAGRQRRRCAVKLIRSWGSFLAGDQSGDCGQDGVEVVASAEVSGQGSPVL